MATLQIQLLGEFSLRSDRTQVIGIAQPRQQSFLAYLLLHRNAPQLRHHLAFCFWPNSSEKQARTNLRQLLHDVRHSLPDTATFLQIDRNAVQWRADAPYHLDVTAFESTLAQAEASNSPIVELARAIELYRGPLLPSCYDDWIAPERERLSQQYAQTLERLLVLLEGENHTDRAIGYAQMLLRHDPLRESTYRALMRLHALNGDRAQALRLHQLCATMLQREFDIEPDYATHELYLNLLHVEAEQQLPATVHRPSAAQPTRLFGRQTEWQQLQHAWLRSNQGDAHVVLMAGEAGIGKTRLCEELQSWAQAQGIVCVSARAYAAEGDLAYGPVIEWVQHETMRAGLARLDPVWQRTLARLLPELLPKPTQTRHDMGPTDQNRQQLFEALARAILAVNPPLLLMIDDLQWCDQATIEWLHFLMRFDSKARLLLVCTVRPEEITMDHPLTALLLDLRRAARMTEIALAPLDANSTSQLATLIAGHEFTVQQKTELFQKTAGNPLFIVEIVRTEQGQQHPRETTAGSATTADEPNPLPNKIQATIEARLAILSPPAHELAACAAAIGRAWSTALLAKALL